MEVKWIKLSTDVFDNRKIKQIEILPDGDSIICIWMKILCLAGNINDKGLVYFTPEIPYTEQMLAAQFNRPLSIVQMAMKVFQQFGMIEVINDIIHISNWEKYQNIDKLNDLREYNRLAQQRHRAKSKESSVNDMSMTCQPCQGTDIDIDIDIDKDKNIRESKPSRHKFGSYSNVLLTQEDYAKWHSECPQADIYIERLSEYMAGHKTAYKSHLAVLRSWYRRDKEKQPTQMKQAASYDLDEIQSKVETQKIKYERKN